MKITVKDCYVLDTDYQNQFISKEIFPEPNYVKLKLSKRSVHQINYNDVYILEPHQFFYVTFNEEMESEFYDVYIGKHFIKNGLITRLEPSENKLYLYNSSSNIIYLQQGSLIGEVNYYG